MQAGGQGFDSPHLHQAAPVGVRAVVKLGSQDETKGSLNRLGEAITDALSVGTTRQDIVSTVATALAKAEAKESELTGLDAGPQGCPIFPELPEGLIDLPSAAAKYGLPLYRLRTWVQRGHLTVIGRLRAPSPGGGYLILSEKELVKHMASPPNKGGRPKGEKPKPA